VKVPSNLVPLALANLSPELIFANKERLSDMPLYSWLMSSNTNIRPNRKGILVTNVLAYLDFC
jgi:hypothetical protein